MRQRQDGAPVRLQPVRRRGDDDAGVAVRPGGRHDHHARRAPWTDKNGDDIAQGAQPLQLRPIPSCEINFASVPTNFGVISLASPDPDLTRPYVDQFNVGVTHEIAARRVGLGRVVPQRREELVERNNVLRPGTYSNGTVTNASYRPVTVFSPIDGTPITMYDTVSAAVGVGGAERRHQRLERRSSRTTRSSSTSRRGCRTARGCSADRRPIARSPTPAAARRSNPNFLLTIGGVNYCDQTNSGIPWRTQFKLAGTFPLPWYGITVRGSFQALPGYILGTSALTAGGAGAPNFTTYSGVGVVLDRHADDTLHGLPGQLGVAGLRRRRAGRCPGMIDSRRSPCRSIAAGHAADAARQPARPVVQQAHHRRRHQVRSEDRHLQRAELGRLLHASASTTFTPIANAALADRRLTRARAARTCSRAASSRAGSSASARW